jgi:hypothetical protein
MDGVRLADRLAYGAGCAARRAGFLHDAYRPEGPADPVDPARRFLRLCVAFVLPEGGVAAPAALGMPYRQAWADWSYLCAGDYLAGPEGVAFIVTIEPPKPMLVVMTNAVVSLVRPAAPVLAGLNGYGAITPGAETALISRFPASLLVGGIGDRTRQGLPDDMRVPGFIAMLPAVAGVAPRVGDILLDGQEQKYGVTAVEVLGAVWRLSLVQAVS